jgi:hypothetical protein
MWIGVALSACFVVFRTVVQYQSSKRFFVNDYWIFFAMLCHIITAILYQVAIPPIYELSYVGARLKPITAGFMNRADLFLRLQFALDMMLWTTLWSVKFSLLFFFWRLFDSVQTPMKILVDYLRCHGINVDYQCSASAICLRPHQGLLYAWHDTDSVLTKLSANLGR